MVDRGRGARRVMITSALRLSTHAAPPRDSRRRYSRMNATNIVDIAQKLGLKKCILKRVNVPLIDGEYIIVELVCLP